MQELIYLSPAKLDRFVSERGRRRPLSALGIDRLGSVTMGDYDERAKLENRLREVRSYLDKSALWFADPTAQPGDWVQFEGDFGYSILNTRQSSLFLMSQTSSTLERDVALLLHGSPQNVRLGVSTNVDLEELASHVSYLFRISEELARLEDPRYQPEENSKLHSDDTPLSERELAVVQLHGLIAELHDGVDYVAGLAKVSMVITSQQIHMYPPEDASFSLSRLVVASPLYVESAPRPR
jgi:hypothetical protein